MFNNLFKSHYIFHLHFEKSKFGFVDGCENTFNENVNIHIFFMIIISFELLT